MHRVFRITLLVTAACAGALAARTAGAAVQFEDRTGAAGAGVESPQETYGASWGDLNGDGFPDLFVSNHRAPPQLLVNRGDGTFYDNVGQVVTWVNKKNLDTHGGSWADLDNDGDQDLLVTAGTGNDQQLFINERGDLLDRSVEYNLAQPQLGGRLPLWLDFDGDELLDVFLTQFGGDSAVYRQTPPGFTFSNAGVVCPKIHYGHLLDVNSDHRLDIVCADDAQFPRNVYDTSTFPFTRITSEFPQVPQVVDSIVADFDNNGEMDVFLINNTLLRPSGASQPRANVVEALLAGTTKSFTFTGASRVSVDLDWKGIDTTTGLNRIVVGANSTEPVFVVPFTLDASDPSVHGIPPADPSRVPYVRIGYDTSRTPPRWVFISDTTNAVGATEYDEMYYVVTAEEPLSNLNVTGLAAADHGGPPTLLLNDGTDFNDTTAGSGLDSSMMCVSAVAGDFDNDTDVDLYLACRTATTNVVNRYYDNDGTGRFTLVPDAGGATGPLGSYITDAAGTADSVVVADYDVDGFLDLFVTNGFNLRPREFGGPKKLYRNQGNGNHWLQLDLVGNGTRDAVGAIVTVTANGITQTRVVNGGYHRWSQDHGRIHFGLGQATSASISILWPDGFTEDHLNVAADALYTATHGAGIAETPPGNGVPYACGAPEVDAARDRGVYIWQDCYLRYWRVRFAAAGTSETFHGRVRADAPFAAVNQVGAPNVLDWSSDPRTLVFDITETNGRFKGFNFRTGTDATSHCLELDAPAGVPIFYGPLEQQVTSGPLQLETGEACEALEPIISVGGGQASEADGSIDFELTLSQASTDTVTVRVSTRDGTAVAGSDYGALSTDVTFQPGQQSRTVTVDIFEDTATEGEETFSLELSNPSGAGLGIATAVGTILDNETATCGSPSYNAGAEAGIFLWKSCASEQWHVRMTAGGGSARYVGALSSTSAFADVTGASLEGSDVVDAASDPTRVQYDLQMVNAGQDGFSFRTAPGAATCFEPPDPAGTAIFVGAARVSGSAPFDIETLGPCRTTGAGIVNVEATSAEEGDPALVFTVKLTAPVDAAVTFDYTVSGITATAGEDFNDPGPGSASIPAGSTTTMISVPLIDDQVAEGDEILRLTISNVQNAAPGVSQADGTIRDDEQSVSCGDPGLQGASDQGAFLWRDCSTGQWRLRISGGGQTWTVYQGSLTASADWSGVSPVLLESNDVVDVDGPVISYQLGVAGSGVDGIDFPLPSGAVCLRAQSPDDEVFIGPNRTPVVTPVDLVTLSPCGGTGGQPTLAATALDSSESERGGAFQLELSNAAEQAVSVDVVVSGVSASPGADFVPVSSTIVFQPGQTSRQVPITLVDDALAEGLETLRLQVSNPQGLISSFTSIEGIIRDDEPSPCGAPVFDAATEPGYFLWKDCDTGRWLLRASAGSRPGGARFDGSIRSTLPWQNVTGHSVEATDTLVVQNSPARIDFGFDVYGQWLDGLDVTPARDASACLSATASIGATVQVGANRLPLTPPFDLNTLAACDVVPTLEIHGATAAEGDDLVFHATLTAPAATAVSFDYQTGNGSAQAGSDYSATSGNAVIPLGNLSTTITVPTLRDSTTEGSETLTVGLSNPGGATLATATATGTITDAGAAPADPSCGQPALDPANEAVLAVWQDCGSGIWHVRAIAGGKGFLTYPGAVDSTAGFADFAGDSLEPDDTLSLSSSTRLLYRLNLSPPHYDGFRFRLNPGGQTCFTPNLPSGTKLVVGAGRFEPPTSSFDLDTLGACSP